MTTVSVCGPPAGAIQTSRGAMWLYSATYLPEVDHVMPTDDQYSEYCLVMDPQRERVVALAKVSASGHWAVRPVVVDGQRAVVARWGGACGQPHVPAALEAMWAAESSLRGAAA